MKPLLLSIGAALLLGAASLQAQGLQQLSAPPPLPFGLQWAMTQREALAALRKAGLEPSLVLQGEKFTRQQIKEIARNRGLDEETVRDAQTWKLYFCGDAAPDSTVPHGSVSIEFLNGHPFAVRWTCSTKSVEQHLALAAALKARYQNFYGVQSASERSAMPSFPPGQIVYDATMSIGAGVDDEDRRPELFYGWSGSVGGAIYGTSIYTSESQYLVVRQITGPLPKQQRRGR